MDGNIDTFPMIQIWLAKLNGIIILIGGLLAKMSLQYLHVFMHCRLMRTILHHYYTSELQWCTEFLGCCTLEVVQNLKKRYASGKIYKTC